MFEVIHGLVTGILLIWVSTIADRFLQEGWAHIPAVVTITFFAFYLANIHFRWMLDRKG